MKTTSSYDEYEETADRRSDDEHPVIFGIRAIDRFFFQPLEPTTLGLMRIATGVVVLYVHLIYSIGLENYLGPYAWVRNTGWTQEAGESGVTDYLRHGNTIQGPSWTWDDSAGEIFRGQTMWSIYYHVEDPFWIRVIHYSILLAMLLFTLGLWTPITSKLVWIGSLMYIQRLQGMLFGMDTMTNLGLFYLMLAPCGAALSLDRWLQVRAEKKRLGVKYVPRPPEPLVSARLLTRAIQINFCLIYAGAGTSKLLGSSWWNATAPAGFLLNYSFAPFEVKGYTETLQFLITHRWMWELLCTIGTVGTLVLELGFPFLVWNRRTRWVMVCGSVLLHTMIALLMGLVTFSLMMLALVISFVPPEATRQWVASVGEASRQLLHVLFGGRRTESSAPPTVALSR
jgi:hypothetical protein